MNKLLIAALTCFVLIDSTSAQSTPRIGFEGLRAVEIGVGGEEGFLRFALGEYTGEDKEPQPRSLWLRDEVAKRFPTLGTVVLIDRQETLRAKEGTSKRHSRLLEIRGPEASLAAARKWIESLDEAGAPTLNWSLQLLIHKDEVSAEQVASARATAKRLGEGQLQDMLRRIRKGDAYYDGGKVKLTTKPLQRSSWGNTRQRAFVKDFDVEVANGTMIADPVVSTLEEGLEVAVCGRQVENGDAWRFEIDLRSAFVERPVERHLVRIASQDLQIEAPSILRWQQQFDHTVKTGQPVRFIVRNLRLPLAEILQDVPLDELPRNWGLADLVCSVQVSGSRASSDKRDR